MISEIVPFTFDDREIRTALKDGNPLFAAMDSARALGYANPRAAIKLHVRTGQRDEVAICDSIGRMQMIPFITEGGLYRLIMRSGMPDAERFQDWVTDEVLPSIRKTGAYVAPQPQSQADIMRTMIDAWEATEARVQRTEARLNSLEGTGGWLTALAYAKCHKLRTDLQYLQVLGKIASAIGKGRAITPARPVDGRFGPVNAWPDEVWDAAYAKLGYEICS